MCVYVYVYIIYIYIQNKSSNVQIELQLYNNNMLFNIQTILNVQHAIYLFLKKKNNGIVKKRVAIQPAKICKLYLMKISTNKHPILLYFQNLEISHNVYF